MMDPSTATTRRLFDVVPPAAVLFPSQGGHRDDSPKAQSRFDRREARARLFGTFYKGKHRAEVTR